MRILHTVESYLPLKHGMSEVVRQLSERLVIFGHDVTVATGSCSVRIGDIINGVKIKSFDIRGSLVEGIQGDVNGYSNFLLIDQFDIIVNFAAQQWATDICIEILPKLKAKKVFVPTGFSGLPNPMFAEYFENMKTWMTLYDRNVFLSNDYRDINFARKYNINNLVLIPNGAAKDEFLTEKSDFDIHSFLGIPLHYKLILHVGSFTGFKGHEEALEIFLSSRQQDTALIFVGENFEVADGGLYFSEKLNWFKKFAITNKFNKKSVKALLYYLKRFRNKYLKNVYAISLDRHQTVAAYQQADLFLFPSLIECSPIVLFEAIASKTPFLVTDVGNAKEIIEWTKGGELLPTVIDKDGVSRADTLGSSKILDNILNDETAMNKMRESGFYSWLERFTWEEIARQYQDMYIKLLN